MKRSDYYRELAEFKARRRTRRIYSGVDIAAFLAFYLVKVANMSSSSFHVFDSGIIVVLGCFRLLYLGVMLGAMRESNVTHWASTIVSGLWDLLSILVTGWNWIPLPIIAAILWLRRERPPKRL
jgi:hypothetical protein